MLTIENAWWNKGGLWQDPDLKRVRDSSLHYDPRPISAEECLLPGVITLRGPRRVGKTVALKLLVADLIEKKGIDPQKIVWTVFDTIGNLESAEIHLLEIWKKYAPSILFIDEVTSLVGWQRVIKKLIDSGTLAQSCLILTGSSAYDLKAGAERMAGRKGGKWKSDRCILPMSFSHFLHQLKSGKPPITLSNETALKWYLDCGGFPFRVDERIKAELSSSPYDPMDSLSVFDDVILYEIARRKFDRALAMETLGRIGQVGCTAMSYESFAKPLTGAKDSIRSYLEAFGDAFLLATLSTYDLARSRLAPKKERKWVWADPALADIPYFMKRATPATLEQKVEWLVGIELLKRHEDRLWEGLSQPLNLFTWKSLKGKEIDYLVVDKSKGTLMPYEVKYQSSISDWDFLTMEKSFQGGTLITKEQSASYGKCKAVGLFDFLSIE